MHNPSDHEINTALLLVGSPKRKKSASFLLGNYLLNEFKMHGIKTRTFMIIDLIRFNDKLSLFFNLLRTHDVLIMSQPLYVDSLPYPVIKAMELIHENQEALQLHGKRLLGIFNNGYPEPHHNDVAAEILKNFTDTVGMHWLGFLALGMGGVITPKNFKLLGRNPQKALRMTAQAIIHGNNVPLKAKKLMEKKLLPKWLYKFFAHRAWKSHAKKYGCYDQLFSTPHETK